MNKHTVFIQVVNHSIFSLSKMYSKIELERIYKMFTGNLPPKSLRSKFDLSMHIKDMVMFRYRANKAKGIDINDPKIADYPSEG